MPKFLDVPQWYTSDRTLVKGIGSSSDMFEGGILVGGHYNNASWYSGATFSYYTFIYCYRISSTTDISFSTSFLVNNNFFTGIISSTSNLSICLDQLGYNNDEKFIPASGNVKVSGQSDMSIYGIYGTAVGTLVAVCKDSSSGLNTSYTEFASWESNATVTVKSVFLRAAEM